MPDYRVMGRCLIPEAQACSGHTNGADLAGWYDLRLRYRRGPLETRSNSSPAARCKLSETTPAVSGSIQSVAWCGVSRRRFVLGTPETSSYPGPPSWVEPQIDAPSPHRCRFFVDSARLRVCTSHHLV